jgi:DNA-directed RNA polymerase specialized sigma24 family protein
MIRTMIEPSSPLGFDVELDYIAKAKGGDKAAMAALVKAWLPLAARMVRTYATSDQLREDALASALLGIVEGVHKVDTSRGVRPWTYIRWSVMDEVMRCLHTSVAAMTIPGVLDNRSSDSTRKAREDALQTPFLLSTPLKGHDDEDMDITWADRVAEHEYVQPTLPDYDLPEEVTAAIEGLTLAQRLAVTGYFGVGGPRLTDAEQSQAQGRAEGTVAVNRRNGMKKLRKVLA